MTKSIRFRYSVEINEVRENKNSKKLAQIELRNNNCRTLFYGFSVSKVKRPDTLSQITNKW